jgi:hypothetical protein
MQQLEQEFKDKIVEAQFIPVWLYCRERVHIIQDSLVYIEKLDLSRKVQSGNTQSLELDEI